MSADLPVAALVKVAQAAERLYRCPFCGEKDLGVRKHQEDCPLAALDVQLAKGEQDG